MRVQNNLPSTNIDNLLYSYYPYIVNSGKKYSHPKRYQDFPEKFVVISTCGFPEKSNFNSMMENFNDITGKKVVGKILCTAGEFLKSPLKEHIQWYLDSVVKAGIEVVDKGYITKDLDKILEKNFIDIETFLKYANKVGLFKGKMHQLLKKQKMEYLTQQHKGCDKYEYEY